MPSDIISAKSLDIYKKMKTHLFKRAYAHVFLTVSVEPLSESPGMTVQPLGIQTDWCIIKMTSSTKHVDVSIPTFAYS